MKPAAWILAAVILTGGRPPLMSPASLQTTSPLGALLPAFAGAWTAATPDHVYQGDGIFEYIDGAGEVYRAYNYQTLISRRYLKAGAADISVELFDMGSSRDAFGVFTHDLEGEDWSIGQDSLYKSGLLQFWRGRYFVSIYADAETAETKAAAADLGKRIAAAIGTDGLRPDLLDLLPGDFRSGGTVRYLHSPVILNYHFFVSRENILRLNETTEAALAARGEKAEKRYLLLIRYPTPAASEEAARSFLAAYLPEIKPAGVSSAPSLVRTEDGLWTGAARKGVYIAIVFAALTEAEARAALAATLSRIGPWP